MYSQQKTTTSIKVQPKQYCKVCADAKKPASMITSHNVRNLKNGAITCPTLLEQCCKNCNQKGHTTSRCKQDDKTKEPSIKKSKQEEPTKKDRTVSAFSALMSDSDSEAEEVEVKAPAKPLLTGYASASALLTSTPLKQGERIFSWPKKIAVKDPNRKFMWADCDSDSGGSEDDEEDEE